MAGDEERKSLVNKIDTTHRTIDALTRKLDEYKSELRKLENSLNLHDQAKQAIEEKKKLEERNEMLIKLNEEVNKKISEVDLGPVAIHELFPYQDGKQYDLLPGQGVQDLGYSFYRPPERHLD